MRDLGVELGGLARTHVPATEAVEVLRNQVTVAIECRGRGLVPELGLDRLHVRPAGDQQTRGRVAQIVDPEPYSCTELEKRPPATASS